MSESLENKFVALDKNRASTPFSLHSRLYYVKFEAIMQRFSFTKLSGAGNDFVLFDRKLNPELSLSSNVISKICDRRMGVGADGVLLISDSDDYAFEMKYYNADGTSGVLCGNGARCALKYGFVSGRVKDDLVNFKANEVDYSGIVLGGSSVKFFLNPPKKIKINFKVKAAKQLITASYIDTGAPHLVIKSKDVLEDTGKESSFYKSIYDLPVFEIGRELRYSPDFEPEGTNVNFIQIIDEVIRLRTYERGVENETFACGTGAVAAAVLSVINDGIKPPVKLFVKSGSILEVDFSIEDQEIKNLSLTGPAEITFTGELTI